MKYYRKESVEVIQWNGDNQIEVSEFIGKVVKDYCTREDGYGNLHVIYWDSNKREHFTTIPKYGWVVIEGKTLQFYKDETFHRTFEPADGNGPIWSSAQEMIAKIEKSFENNYQSMLDKWLETLPSDANKLQKYAVNEKDVESDTFDSVLDEMKELHAKKNKDYGDAFHKSFVEFGPVAAVVRLNDKMERIKSLIKNGKAEVKDESVLDSLRDLACYAVMLYVELKNKDNGTDKD